MVQPHLHSIAKPSTLSHVALIVTDCHDKWISVDCRRTTFFTFSFDTHAGPFLLPLQRHCRICSETAHVLLESFLNNRYWTKLHKMLFAQESPFSAFVPSHDRGDKYCVLAYYETLTVLFHHMSSTHMYICLHSYAGHANPWQTFMNTLYGVILVVSSLRLFKAHNGIRNLGDYCCKLCNKSNN